MAKEEKSVIEQALLEAQQIDATFKANAKEILAKTMGSEIEEMVKESLGGSRKAINEDEDDDMEATDLDLGADDELDLEMGDDEADDLDLGLDLGDDELGGEDEEIVDLTGVDNNELIRVFKAMDPDSEIEVVQDENGISFTDTETGAEYKVELGGGLGDEMELEDDELEDEVELEDDELEDELDNEDVIDLDGDELDMEDDEEVVYEIEITEEDEDEEEEDELEEGSRTLGSGRSHGRRGLDKPKTYKKMSESVRPRVTDVKLVKENKVLNNKLSGLVTENKELKENQEKMVDALKQFRQKLQEVAVFNSNLAHVVRLFTENTTTKEEKVDIVKRMDEATTLKESKIIFKTLEKELQSVKSKKTIQESVDAKVNKTASTGSKEMITESKVYAHPELEKMKKMWEFNYKY
jgi:hypothetical protein